MEGCGGGIKDEIGGIGAWRKGGRQEGERMKTKG